MLVLRPLHSPVPLVAEPSHCESAQTVAGKRQTTYWQLDKQRASNKTNNVMRRTHMHQTIGKIRHWRFVAGGFVVGKTSDACIPNNKTNDILAIRQATR